MTKTRMEAGLEQVESDLQQFPTLKKEMVKLRVEFNNSIAAMAQRLEDSFRLILKNQVGGVVTELNQAVVVLALNLSIHPKLKY